MNTLYWKQNRDTLQSRIVNAEATFLSTLQKNGLDEAKKTLLGLPLPLKLFNMRVSVLLDASIADIQQAA